MPPLRAKLLLHLKMLRLVICGDSFRWQCLVRICRYRRGDWPAEIGSDDTARKERARDQKATGPPARCGKTLRDFHGHACVWQRGILFLPDKNVGELSRIDAGHIFRLEPKNYR